MKDIELSSMINLAKEVFENLKTKYKDNLEIFGKDKILDNLDVTKFFNIYEEDSMPPFYYFDNKCYINKVFFKDFDDIEKMIPFFCLAFLCGNLNPLKLGLIEVSIRSNNYEVLDRFNKKEYEVANLLSNSFLEDLPLNIIFFDNNIDIINYLSIEKGSKVALFYNNISNLIEERYKKLNNSSLNNYLDFYNKLDYSDILDLIYDFITSKSK